MLFFETSGFKKKGEKKERRKKKSLALFLKILGMQIHGDGILPAVLYMVGW